MSMEHVKVRKYYNVDVLSETHDITQLPGHDLIAVQKWKKKNNQPSVMINTNQTEHSNEMKLVWKVLIMYMIPGEVNRIIRLTESINWFCQSKSNRIGKNVNPIGFDHYSINFDGYSTNFDWYSINFDLYSINFDRTLISFDWPSINFDWTLISFDWLEWVKIKQFEVIKSKVLYTFDEKSNRILIEFNRTLIGPQ